MTDGPYNVLFLCTGNSARSILAEAILEREGAGNFKSFSAGSDPKGAVNPYAVRLLDELGYDTSGYRSKSWEEFLGPDAPGLDFIFTVCDDAAESCPVFPGHPSSAHWGLEDPAAVQGEPAEIAAAFAETYRLMSNRIKAFVALPLASIDDLSLRGKLKAIGRQEGATEKAARA